MFGSANINTGYTFTSAKSFSTADKGSNGTSQKVSHGVVHFKGNYKQTTSLIDKYAKNNSEIKQKKVGDENQSLINGQQGDEDSDLVIQDSEFIPTSFAELAVMVGGSESRITKEQLLAYLKSMQETSSAAAITVVKNLIAQYNNLSDENGFITSLNGLKEAQDYKTITSEQVTSPIDIRI